MHVHRCLQLFINLQSLFEDGSLFDLAVLEAPRLFQAVLEFGSER
jgi:hypothetical protein